jgi:hypothetical protein
MSETKEIKIRIYKATDNLDACQRFAYGHAAVLESYGIKKVTSSSTSWFYDKDVYLMMVESISGDIIYGGTRIHIKNNEFKLPLESAIEDMAPEINTLLKFDKNAKTGELCGLWNAKIMSGSGLSTLLIKAGVAKAGIFVAEKLNLKSLYTLSAPWTIGTVQTLGFVLEESVGNKGRFEYPTPDLIATVLVLKDIETLKNANYQERKDILSLRENPIQTRTENGPKGNMEVEYNLLVSVKELKKLQTEC